MHRDPCFHPLDLVPSFDPHTVVEFLVKYTGIAKKTPPERITQAVTEELEHLRTTTLGALDALRPAVRGDALGREAFVALEDAGSGAFPRQACEELGRAARGAGLLALAEVLERGAAGHRALEQRITWLVGGTTDDELAKLDPLIDCDRIHHAVSSAFRVEGRILETLAINRVAQIAAASLFFRSTKEAESNPVFRFYDTYTLFANFFEWGIGSRRGQETVARMNAIHGRYYIPNDGMKYVLLQSAFTFVDGAEKLGHRPLTSIERRGFFHAYVGLGRAMNIAGLSDDFEAMHAWFTAQNEANAAPAPLKTATFETFVERSLAAVDNADFRRVIVLAARVGMDDTLRSALGYAAPSPAEAAAVRAVMFTLGHLVRALPKTPYLRSLHNNPARSAYTRPSELGVRARSPSLPALSEAVENGGFPTQQRPTSSPESAAPLTLPTLGWDEVRRHRAADDLWIVLDGEVYDISSFAAQHPGTLQRLLEVAGTDASAQFHAAPHGAMTQIFKLNYRIGRVPA